jgi:BMFP domain-containing protein YqiC
MNEITREEFEVLEEMVELARIAIEALLERIEVLEKEREQ